MSKRKRVYSRHKKNNGYKKYNMTLPILMLVCIMLISGCKTSGEGAKQDDDGGEKLLSIFVQQSVSTESGIWQGSDADKLYDDTGIKLDFKSSGSDVEMKLKQFIAAGTLPDIIGFRNAAEARYAIDAGLLMPLESYREELPSIFENEIYDKAIEYSTRYNDPDGENLLIMPTEIGAKEDNETDAVPTVLWDSFKRADYPSVSKLEDYLDAAEAMLKEKPLNQFGKRTYGFTLFADWDKYSISELASLANFYGIDNNRVSSLMEVNMETHQVNDILDETSFYKRALHFYYMANQRGLLDPDSRTQSYSNAQKKYDEGRVLFSWNNSHTVSFNSEEAGNINNQRMTNGYISLPADDMKILDSPDGIIGNNWYFAINKNTKNVKAACEFLNWLYAEDTSKELYESDGGGLAVFQALPLLNTEKDADHIDESRLGDEVRQAFGTEDTKEYIERKKLATPSTAAVYMVPTAQADIRDMESSIGEIVRENSWEAIYASDETEFQRIWDNMVQKAEEAGLHSVSDYYREAWKEAIQRAAQYE